MREIVEDTQETQGRRPCDDGDREWSDVATGQGTPRIVGNHQSLEEARRPLLESLEGT